MTTSGKTYCSLNPTFKLPCSSMFFGSTPRKSFTRGNTSILRRVKKSSLFFPRSVTWSPTTSPTRVLKFEIAFFAFRTAGFWPASVESSFITSGSTLSSKWAAPRILPTPTDTTIFSNFPLMSFIVLDLKLGVALLADPDRFAPFPLPTHAHRLPAGRADGHEVRHADGALDSDKLAFLALALRARMLLVQIQPLDDREALARKGGQDLSGLPLVLSGRDFYGVFF